VPVAFSSNEQIKCNTNQGGWIASVTGALQQFARHETIWDFEKERDF